jgi:hypothetical protein
MFIFVNMVFDFDLKPKIKSSFPPSLQLKFGRGGTRALGAPLNSLPPSNIIPPDYPLLLGVVVSKKLV